MNKQNSIDMTNKLITPQFMEAIKNFPLYSQEEKGKDAICVAVFTIGHIMFLKDRLKEMTLCYSLLYADCAKRNTAMYQQTNWRK